MINESDVSQGMKRLTPDKIKKYGDDIESSFDEVVYEAVYEVLKHSPRVVKETQALFDGELKNIDNQIEELSSVNFLKACFLFLEDCYNFMKEKGVEFSKPWPYKIVREGENEC